MPFLFPAYKNVLSLLLLSFPPTHTHVHPYCAEEFPFVALSWPPSISASQKKIEYGRMWSAKGGSSLEEVGRSAYACLCLLPCVGLILSEREVLRADVSLSHSRMHAHMRDGSNKWREKERQRESSGKISLRADCSHADHPKILFAVDGG